MQSPPSRSAHPSHPSGSPLTIAAYSVAEKLLYRKAPGIYRAAYSVFKALTDREERKAVRSLVKPGMNVLDIGANIGTYTEFLWRLVGPAGHVHAFEPEERNFRLLRHYLANRPNVSLNRVAVSDRSGNLQLYLSPRLNVDHRTFSAGDGRQGVTVPGISIDDYLPEGEKVDFAKIDVQGYECKVLAGMRKTLARSGPMSFLIEYSPSDLAQAGNDGDQLLSALTGSGLDLFTLGRRGGLIPLRSPFPPLNRLGYTNLVALRQ